MTKSIALILILPLFFCIPQLRNAKGEPCQRPTQKVVYMPPPFGVGPAMPVMVDQCGDDDIPSQGNSQSGDASNFNDVVSLKNGEILTEVKAAVTGDSVVVTTKDGKVSVYNKKDIAGIKKQ